MSYWACRSCSEGLPSWV